MSALLTTLGAGALSIFNKRVKPLLLRQKSDSLVSLTQVARIEPITMIDQTLQASPYLEDVLHSLVSLFSGYYLQAIALTSSVSNVSVMNRLDSLNPNRSSGLKITGINIGTEMLQDRAYEFGLPRQGMVSGLEAYGLAPLEAIAAQESFADKVSDGYDAVASSISVGQTAGAKLQEFDEHGNPISSSHELSRVGDIVQSAPLSIGKMLDVSVTENGNTASVPVSVRLLSTVVAPNVLSHILSDGTKNITWKERWHGWRSGELDLWRDIVLATDLVDEHRKAILSDRSGAYQEILSRRRGNVTAAALSATPSLATASNLMVISKTTAQEVERKMRTKLNDSNMRNRMFQMSYLMILVVVDQDRESVTFYHRGVSLPTVCSVRELKASARGNGPDIATILAQLLAGKPPVL